MPADTCGARYARLVCDKAPHVDGDHRGYDEEHDRVLFWPTAAKRLDALEERIADLLDELATDPQAHAAAMVRIRLACSRPTRARS